MEKIRKIRFYSLKLSNSNFERIYNNDHDLEINIDHLLHEYGIKTVFETIAEKIILLEKHGIKFKEYIR